MSRNKSSRYQRQTETTFSPDGLYAKWCRHDFPPFYATACGSSPYDAIAVARIQIVDHQAQLAQLLRTMQKVFSFSLFFSFGRSASFFVSSVAPSPLLSPCNWRQVFRLIGCDAVINDFRTAPRRWSSSTNEVTAKTDSTFSSLSFVSQRCWFWLRFSTKVFLVAVLICPAAQRDAAQPVYVEEGSSSHLLIPAIFFRTILSSMVRETKTVLYTSPSSKIGGGRLSLGCCVTAGSFRIRQPPPYIQRAGISPPRFFVLRYSIKEETTNRISFISFFFSRPAGDDYLFPRTSKKNKAAANLELQQPSSAFPHPNR